MGSSWTGLVSMVVRQTSTWHSSTSSAVIGVSRSDSAQPRAVAWSRAVTRAGHQVEARSWSARSGSTTFAKSSVHGAGVEVGHGGGDGGFEVAVDAPPEGGCGVVVGQDAFGSRGREQAGGVDAGAGQPGELAGQGRLIGVVSDGGADGGEQGCPFGQGRVAVSGELLVEPVLVACCGSGELWFPGGSQVGVGDGHRRPPHRDLTEQRRRWARPVAPTQAGVRGRLGSLLTDLVGERW